MKNRNTRRGFTQTTDYLSLEGEGGTKYRVRGKVHKANLICTPSSALQASSPSRGKETARGFTLIELLVVVLIIGILAAVAVPQYQKAVLKSRYTQFKVLAKAIADAQEVYRYANRSYASSFSALDLDIGGTPNDTDSQRTFDNENVCSLQNGNVNCGSFKFPVSYQIHYQRAYQGGTHKCIAGNVDLSSVENKLCQAETGKNSPDYTDTTYTIYYYPNN